MESVGDLYVFRPGGGEEFDRSRADRAEVRARYAALLRGRAGLDEMTADLVMALLFDHHDTQGRPCERSSHPRLPEGGEHSHDAGFDCPCTWDEERRAQEKEKWRSGWAGLRTGPAAEAARIAEDHERAAVEAWTRDHPGVEAQQTGWACPEVWEGRIDGRSFFFRERHGEWRIELDVRPDGHVAERVVGTSAAGEFITQTVELTSGEVIAEGMSTALGEGPVEHLSFIVDTVRTHLGQLGCAHEGAGRYCPSCGRRMDHDART